MSVLDPFPVDQNRIIKSLERRIEALEALVRTQAGAPVTKASGAFFLPNSGTPDTPVGGALVYASSGDFRVRTSGGVIKQMPGIGVSVPNATNNLALAPATYNKAHLDQCINSIDTLFVSHGALLASLRGAPVINT
ncbi:hypothetical protein [Streptosporangium sp. G12]